jgi:S-DNA-T family DNA segregation ATPase FtsK/SpoIIIE
VDVITALIKANCPARISFQVAQKVDSRIILDVNGAETLLGKGDMLYRSPATTLPIRIQAPNITEEEIEIIVQETQHYDFVGYIELPEEQEIDADFGFNQIDEDLIKKAWRIILETGKTSTSYIQRRLRIGYNRAANIMEKLEEMGYLSPAIGNKPREILRRD